ncbi:MAG: lipid A biosynthesis acyltransferase [Verrucomicrobia bacterium]|nr:MAG: lipid A biosynthesis acyltransferase [Verrucomicrobiota bacterium]
MKFARYLLEYLVARALLAILALLPLSFARRVAVAGSRVLFACLPRLRRIGLRNLELAFSDLSPTERRQLLEQSFENFGRIIADFAHFPRSTPTDLAARVESSLPQAWEVRYRAAKVAGRGVIFVTPHLGNWEMLALAMSAIFEPIAYLARPLDNPLLDRYTSRVRSRFGNRPINKRDSVLQGLAILDGGGNLGLLADVNTLQRDGVFVPFFGHLACTTRSVAMLALRTDALIVPVCCVWNTNRYRILVGEPVEAVRSASYAKKNIIDTTALYTAEIEKFIRDYPGQWIWIHRRWKTRPSGEPSLY